jgi:hypothetical protein
VILKIKSSFEFFAALIISLIIPIISYRSDKVYFQTNDDFGIIDLLSGFSSGQPARQISRVFEPLDLILRSLYIFNPQIAWYLVFHLLLQGLSIFILMYIIFSQLNNFSISLKFIILLLLTTFLISFNSIFYVLQYTQVAIIAAGSGALGLIYLKNRSIYFLSLLLMLCGILLRPQAGAPTVVVVLLIVGLVTFINQKNVDYKFYIKRVIFVMGFSSLAFIYFSFSYNTWSNWIEQDTQVLIQRQEAMRSIYDYRPYVEINDIKKSVAKEVGLSGNDYELFNLYYVADADYFNAEILSNYESELKNKKDLDNLLNIFKAFISYLFNNYIYLILFVLFIFLASFYLSKRSAVLGLLVLMAYLSLLFLTLLSGKVPYAVLIGTLFVSLSTFLAALVVTSSNQQSIVLDGTKNYFHLSAASAFIVGLITISVIISAQQRMNIIAESSWRDQAFLEEKGISRVLNYEFDRPVVAFSSFYSQIEKTYNPADPKSMNSGLKSKMIRLGWGFFEPSYLEWVETFNLNPDLLSSVATGDAYLGSANIFEVQVVTQYLKEKHGLLVTWEQAPFVWSDTLLSVWRVESVENSTS